MRELVFGGSFNPPHAGHLICARLAAEGTGSSRVVLMPSGQSPHKNPQIDTASASDRVAMCRVAVENDPLFHVDDRETRRPGKSFTFETVRQMLEEGHREVHWLIGADMLNYLPQWHRAVELIEICQFVVMKRPGHLIDWSKIPQAFHRLQVAVVDTPLIDISSTAIRGRVASGKSIRHFVPLAVERYIASKRLYSHMPAVTTVAPA